MWRVNRYPAKEKKNWSDINQMKKKPPRPSYTHLINKIVSVTVVWNSAADIPPVWFAAVWFFMNATHIHGFVSTQRL
jgi:hypothetical protein